MTKELYLDAIGFSSSNPINTRLSPCFKDTIKTWNLVNFRLNLVLNNTTTWLLYEYPLIISYMLSKE